MSQWRREAIERFPGLIRVIADAENVGTAWIQLHAEFQKSYYNYPFSPDDADFERRVYDYAHWSLHHPSIDVRTAVVLGFYERLPNHDQIRHDMARCLSQDDFDLLGFAWRYLFRTDEAVRAWEQEFREAKERLRDADGNGKAKKRSRG